MSTTLNTLVLGATGSIGYAVTANLLARQIPVTILVRDRAKAEALFPDAPTLTIIEGDAQDATLLNELAVGKTHIFHGINYPYDKWFGNMDTVTRKVINAAAINHATIVFPGNVYNFGNTTTPIRENSTPAPISRKGQLRVELEAMLEQAAEAGTCQVLNVRLPDFWGPNVLNAGVAPIYENALKGKTVNGFVNVDIPHQLVYTKDAAEIIVRLMLHGQTKPYEVWNYGGETVPSMRSLFGRISTLVGKPLPVRVYPRLLFQVFGIFSPLMREVNEMLYLWGGTVVLDDTKVRTTFPDFRETPLDTALTETLTWFAENRLKMSFTPAVKSKPVVFN
ncbi:NAD-dependent epimerase/dehydratase family protein [Spirosoma sp. KUDC1026]|uniref:NAD-dependent epimerase/dehydratase family protein n=1 Tax=Spirosoma sp. KUDC1026 TaxID=2745947 RepID=UPI00159BE93B|nr:NAD-dependent epimerase/dehydratase family protein [Spirosoma sp. KUDC1026]QKZ14440.1 NAD-dependent epimerase/dehydratase family protein [Spirosoma sp. KUDC1026]